MAASLSVKMIVAVWPILRTDLSLEIAIDGGEFRPVFPEDDLLDTREERFAIDVTTLSGLLRPLTPGSHIASVRVYDAAGNHGASEVGFTIPQPAATPAAARRPR